MQVEYLEFESYEEYLSLFLFSKQVPILWKLSHQKFKGQLPPNLLAGVKWCFGWGNVPTDSTLTITLYESCINPFNKILTHKC